MVLVIPAQPATSNEERQAVLFSCNRDGSLLLEGKDGKKPARFSLKPGDSFPWEQFLPKLLVNRLLLLRFSVFYRTSYNMRLLYSLNGLLNSSASLADPAPFQYSLC